MSKACRQDVASTNQYVRNVNYDKLLSYRITLTPQIIIYWRLDLVPDPVKLTLFESYIAGPVVKKKSFALLWIRITLKRIQ